MKNPFHAFINYLLGSSSHLVVLVILSFFSCGKPESEGALDHPEYFDSIFHKADSLYLPMSEKDAAAFVDSIFSVYPNPGPGDLYKKYEFKRYYFLVHKKDKEKALIYADSMLFVLKNEKLKPAYVEEYGKALFLK